MGISGVLSFFAKKIHLKDIYRKVRYTMSKQIKIALLMAASLFMEIMDGTIVITALPQMAKDFQTSISQMSLLVSIYLVTVAIFLPLSGWIANYVGKKRVWLFAVLLFTGSSLGSALAKDFPFLLMMRIVQGISGALMTPTARLIVLEKTPARELLKMTSYFVWPALIAPAIAPVIGGAIVSNFNWHWIFLINIPIGFVIVILGISMIPKDTVFMRNKFDWVGFSGIAGASALLVLGAELATHSNISLITAGVLVIVVGLFIGMVTYNHLNKSKQPLFSLKALKITSFRISQSSGAVLWLSVGAMPYLLTLFLQNIFHWSAVVAGSYVLFIFLGNIGIKPFTTPIIRTLKYKGALFASFTLVLCSSIAMAFIAPTTYSFIIMAFAFISGVGRSLALTAFNGLNLSEIEPQDRNSANTLNAIVQTLAQGMGIAFISLMLHLLATMFDVDIAYSISFIILGVIMLFPIWEVLKVPNDIGSKTI